MLVEILGLNDFGARGGSADGQVGHDGKVCKWMFVLGILHLLEDDVCGFDSYGYWDEASMRGICCLR